VGHVDRTVFISYRRSGGAGWAARIHQDLVSHGYDTFFDVETPSSGDFEHVILANIQARAHFLIFLTPSALQRVSDPGDWVRREIESALVHRRNIVPLMIEGIAFESPAIAKHLIGGLAPLRRYQALTIPLDDSGFDTAMAQLRSRFLNASVGAVRHPPVVLRSGSRVRPRTVTLSKAALVAERAFELGVLCDEAREYAHAVRNYSEALRFDPNYVEALSNRGLARLNGGDITGALHDCDAAIAIGPRADKPYCNRGLAMARIGLIPNAIDDFTQAIVVNPNNPVAFYNRALARYARRHLHGALEDYSQAVALRPTYHDAWVNRGIVRKALNDLVGAIEDYSRAIAVRPSDGAVAYFNRGTAYAQLSEFSKALHDYTAAVRIDSTHAYTFNHRGIARMEIGDVSSALSDYSESIRLDPDNAPAYLNRSLALERDGNFGSAARDIERYLIIARPVESHVRRDLEERIAMLHRRARLT